MLQDGCLLGAERDLVVAREVERLRHEARHSALVVLVLQAQRVTERVLCHERDELDVDRATHLRQPLSPRVVVADAELDRERVARAPVADAGDARELAPTLLHERDLDRRRRARAGSEAGKAEPRVPAPA
jgi:hypothetical protein